jgi:hypothetical protein
MTSLSLAGMHIQFRTLIFHSRLKEQLQQRLHLKKFVISLSAAIEALGFSLGPHPESDLATHLSVFFCTSKNRVVKIVHSSFEVVL